MLLRLWKVDFYIVTWKSHIVRTNRHCLLFSRVLCSITRKFLIYNRKVFILFYWTLSFDSIVLSLFCYFKQSVYSNSDTFEPIFVQGTNILFDVSDSSITSTFDYFIFGDRPFGSYAYCVYFCWRYSPFGSSMAVVRLW